MGEYKYRSVRAWLFGLGRLISAAAMVCSTTALALSSDEIRRDFPVESGQLLEVEADDADVYITAHEGADVRVEIVRTAQAVDEATEQRMLERHTVDINQKDGRVRIKSRLRPQLQTSKLHIRQFNVRINVLVPWRFDTDLKTADGNVHVEGVDGHLRAHTSDGDIGLKDVQGDLRVDTSDGDLQVSGGGGTLWARTADGDVLLKSFEGPSQVRTSDGRIVATALTRRLRARTEDGDIEVSFLGAIPDSCSIEAGDGNIAIEVDGKQRLSFECKTGDGRIHSSSAFGDKLKSAQQEEDKLDRMQGDLNGGGPLLLVRTADGDINLKKR
jgi:DUF4097 and DUF4098 domain-containing protein YvlB